MSRHSDIAEIFNARRERRREFRLKYGQKCVACTIREPRRSATILLPGDTCYCGYKDDRPPINQKPKP